MAPRTAQARRTSRGRALGDSAGMRSDGPPLTATIENSAIISVSGRRERRGSSRERATSAFPSRTPRSRDARSLRESWASSRPGPRELLDDALEAIARSGGEVATRARAATSPLAYSLGSFAPKTCRCSPSMSSFTAREDPRSQHAQADGAKDFPHALAPRGNVRGTRTTQRYPFGRHARRRGA